MIRRKLLKLLSGMPLGGMILGIPATAQAEALRDAKPDIYSALGVRTLINARGTVTIIGATKVLPEVREAMESAVHQFVQLDELMEGVGKKLSQLTGAEWGVVTSGASAGITIATAACITGGDPDKLWKMPDLSGLKNEVIVPSYSRTAYEAGVRATGVRMVEVSTMDELARALSPRTAMILVLAGARSMNGPLSLKKIVSLARPKGVPVLVDAAAEDLVIPNPHLTLGADMVVYSGGKCLRGPQCAGLLIGRNDLVRAAWMCSAPHHGFGRGLKVGREEVMGMLTAVEMWWKRDHQAEQKTWTSWVESIQKKLTSVPNVQATIIQPTGLSNRAPELHVEWDASKIPLTGYQLEQLLWDGAPRIAVSGMGSYLPFPPNQNPTISIFPSQMEPEEVSIVADRVVAMLTNPPNQKNSTIRPDVNLTGQWDVEMKFVASTVMQSFVLQQDGNELAGTHHADFASRDLVGAMNGKQVLIRSSYTRQGVRLNFEFTGTADGNTMMGQVMMGEYGPATWKATRRN